MHSILFSGRRCVISELAGNVLLEWIKKTEKQSGV
jgi:hypothetical protein